MILFLVLGLIHVSGSDLIAKKKAIGALGRLGPSNGIIEVGAPSGYILMEILVKEGDLVEKGKPIAVIRAANQETSGVDMAQLDVKEADESGKQKIALQRLRVKEIEETGKKALELKNIEVRLAEMQYNHALRALERLIGGGAETYSAQQKEEQEHLIRVTQKKLDLVKQELEKLKIDLKTKLNLATQELGHLALNREINLSRARTKLEAGKKKLNQTTLNAPSDGTILEILRSAGESSGGGPVLRMADLRQMDVIAEVFEGDILHLSPGMKANISSNSLPNPLTGKIVSISRIVSPRSRNMKVIIRLDNSEVASRLINLEVSVSIDLD